MAHTGHADKQATTVGNYCSIPLETQGASVDMHL